MAKKPLSFRRAALLASAVAVTGILTSCGGGADTASTPRTESGTAVPATGGPTTASAASDTGPTTGTATPRAQPSDSVAPIPTATVSEPESETAAGGRCHTSELRASVGRNNPGAGQENFPVVLTNTSSRTCTVHGYPGAAFLDASGKQLGPDPKRSADSPTTVTLAPGRSAWAGLTFSNPEVSGARSATPKALLVTPPDERDPLTVKWTGGEVPVSGNASTVRLLPFSPGTGA
ncbi:DUF4232 domain-containing protein [Streptomyces sp. NPDC050619]|uniref:DUF4232 domain-containing protein n=1 Tax=Streptomyces sp. NPDC050619 TaxID=3157214 RepID=UPI0034265D1D